MPSHDSHVDASPTFFRRFSAELVQLAADFEHLQVSFGFVDAEASDTETAIRVQALDELVQRARALADVAGYMTIEAPSSPVAIQRIIGGIGLRSLAARLAGEAPAAATHEGEFHLF